MPQLGEGHGRVEAVESPQGTMKGLHMRSHIFILGLAMSAAACADTSWNPEEKTLEATSEAHQADSTAGTWVNLGGTFGPCLVLPATCQVGDQIAAHSGPGNAGGCFNYKCELLGTWVNLGGTFGPCLVLPATCQVGDKIAAHSGPGNAGGCFNYQCE